MSSEDTTDKPEADDTKDPNGLDSKAKELLNKKDQKLTLKDKEIEQLRTQLTELRTALGDNDPAAAAAALAKLEELEHRDMVDRGDYEKALKARDEKHKKELEAKEAEIARLGGHIDKKVLVDDLRKALTSGQNAEGKAIPRVESRVDGLMSFLREERQPFVKFDEDSKEYKSFVRIDGIDRDLTDWVQSDWLSSEAAKDWVAAASNVGGSDGGKPSVTFQGSTRVVTEADASGALEDIASGKATVAV